MISLRSTLKKLYNIMTYLMKTGTLSDVTFVVGVGSSKKSFKVHKLLLAVRSDIFERMFFGTSALKEDIIELPDVSEDIFRIMIKFIYEDRFEVKSILKAVDAFSIAFTYNITELMQLSREYIEDHLNTRNASLLYEMSICFNDQVLIYICSEFINENVEEIIKSQSFTQISFETVKSMVEMRSFRTANQLLLFQSLMEWAKARIKWCQGDESAEKLRQLMDPFLPKIRFTSMSCEELTQAATTSGIFNDSEIAKMFMNTHISAPNLAPLPDWCKQEESLKQQNLPSVPGSDLKNLVSVECGTKQKVYHTCPADGEVSCGVQMTSKEMASWQSELETLCKIMPYLLQTGTFSDFTFFVGNGSSKKSFKVHKLFLAVRSNIFKRMFFGTSTLKGDIIHLPDVSPDIFGIMLSFIYEDKFEVKSMDEAMETCRIAFKYRLTELMHLSCDYVESQINIRNVCLVYQMSLIYKQKYLKSICSRIINEDIEEIIESEAFTQISFKTLRNMIKITSFHTTNQFLIFQSLIKWAKAELERHKHDKSVRNLRQLMNPFLPKIRFLSMNSEEFLRGPSKCGIFTESEIFKVLSDIIVPRAVLCQRADDLEGKLSPTLPQSEVITCAFQ